MKDNKYSLQILNHDTIFATREEAIAYINEEFKNKALLAEPAIVFYGESTSPKVILAIGSGDRKVFMIDTAELDGKIETIGDVSDATSTDVETVKAELENLIAVCGLIYDENVKNNPISYEPNAKDELIGDAVSLSEAIGILSEYVQKQFANVELAVADATTKADKALSDAKVYTDAETTRAKAAEQANADAIEELEAKDVELKAEIDAKVGTVEIVKNSQSDLQYILKVDGVDAGEINIPEDQFLKSVTYNETSKEVEFIFKTSEGESTVKISIADLVDTYTAGNGLSVSENVFSVKIDPSSETYLSVSADGIKVSGIDAKLNEKANVSDVYTKTEADAKFLTEHQDLSALATKDEVSIISDDLTALSEKVAADEIVLSKLDGNEAVEGSVANAIKVAKAYTDSSIETETTRAKAAEQANADAIAVLNGNEAVEGSVANAIKVVKEYADAAVLVETNERVEAVNAINSELTTKANSDDVYTKAEIDAKGYLTEHQDISGKADKTDLTSLEARVKVNEDAITVINGNEAEVGSIKNALAQANSYTDTQVATKVGSVEIVKNTASDLQYILKVDGAEVSYIDIPKDQFLKDVSYDSGNKELVFNFIVSDSETAKEVRVDVSDLVDTYTNGNGLSLTDNTFSIKVDPSSESYLSLGVDGIKVSGIDAKLAEKANVSDVYTKVEADAKFLTEHQDISTLATKDEVEIVADNLADVKVVVDKLDGSVETEGSVKYLVNTTQTTLSESLSAEVERAKAAEQANADAIAILNGDGTGSVTKSIADAISVKANSEDVYTKHEIDDMSFLTQADIEGLASDSDLTAVKADVAAIQVVDDTQNTKISSIESELVRLNLTTNETNSIKPTLSKTDEGTTLSADVKLDTDKNNIIKISGNGVYAEVTMTYDTATNTLTFSNGVSEQSFVLSDQSLLTAGSYDSTNKEIVLTITKSDATTQEIRIPIGDIINDWDVLNEKDNLITLTKTAGTDGVDLLSANISISTHEDNGVLKDNGTLFVSKAAKDHTTTWDNGTTTVQSALDQLKTEADKVEGLVSDVDTLKTDVAAMKVNITALQGSLEKAETNIAANTEKIANNAGAITNLNSQFQSLSSEVTNMSNSFVELKTTVEAYEDRITTAESSISALQTTVNALKEQMGDAGSSTSTVYERLDAIEDVLSKLIDFGTYE